MVMDGSREQPSTYCFLEFSGEYWCCPTESTYAVVFFFTFQELLIKQNPIWRFETKTLKGQSPRTWSKNLKEMMIIIPLVWPLQDLGSVLWYFCTYSLFVFLTVIDRLVPAWSSALGYHSGCLLSQSYLCRIKQPSLTSEKLWRGKNGSCHTSYSRPAWPVHLIILLEI